MKKRYEHRPGLFGLASIAAGYAPKNRQTQTRGLLTAAAGEIYEQSESQSEPASAENWNPSNSSGPSEKRADQDTYQSRKCLKQAM